MIGEITVHIASQRGNIVFTVQKKDIIKRQVQKRIPFLKKLIVYENKFKIIIKLMTVKKLTMGYHFIPIWFAKVKHWEMSNIGRMRNYRNYYDLLLMDPGQPFWRTIWTYVIKLNTSICYGSSTLYQGIFFLKKFLHSTLRGHV